MQNYIKKIKDFFALPIRKNKIDKDIPKEDKEIDPLDALSTLDQKSESVRKKSLNRIIYTTLFLSFGVFILSGLVKFFILVSHNSERKPIKTKTEKLGLKINTFSKWQELKDQQIVHINKDIKNVNTNLTKKIHLVKHELKQDINNTTNKIIAKINDTQTKNSKFVTSALNDIKKEIQKSEENSKNYIDTKSLTIDEKIKQIKKNTKNNKVSGLDFSKLSLPKLPQNKTLQVVKTHNKAKVNKRETYKEVEESVVVTKEKINFSAPDMKKAKAPGLPSFTIMPGFTKATIITGAAVPTLTQAKSVSRPVWLSFNGNTLIANNDTMDVGNCLIQAAATGDFSSGVAEIRLSKLSCSATGKNGQKYKLVTPVKGWVYSESGLYGLKGRLVSKEGTIIEKAIPLAVIEGLVSAMKNLGSSSSSNTYYGGTSTTPGQNFVSGAAGGTSKAMNKISDYYLKILASLNPVIEVKAGRQVVVAFAGGEKAKFVKYTPADVAYFEKKDDEDE